MKLQLFDFITETIEYFDANVPDYEYVMEKLVRFYETLFQSQQDKVVAFHSRVKTEKSLKEKLIRNQFYLEWESGEQALHHLSDLIGVTLQCKFIRNEAELYQFILDKFNRSAEGYSASLSDPNVFLNLRMLQPQYQRNGFTIYRIDGYYLYNGKQINYELQIKSLVHAFWSEIEHEVVYKNPDFVVYDRFNKAMLGAIRDNLDVVDRQLEIMYKEIGEQSERRQIGMDEKGFKIFTAQSINELVNRKMIESVGFTTDFKKCSAILAQYIYIRDFANGEHNRETMVDYLEHLNYLSQEELDFTQEITLEKPYKSDNPFCHIMGKYWEKVLNTDFQWHIFFAMLFSIQPGDNYEDMDDFANVIRILLIQPGWYVSTFESYSKEEKDEVRDFLAITLAQSLVSIGTINIVHEDNLYHCMEVFRRYVGFCEEKYPSFSELKINMNAVASTLRHQISVVFH